MKKHKARIFFLMHFFVLGITYTVLANEPDSVYLFSYVTMKDQGSSGLHFAWSEDGKQWNQVSNEYGFVKSDYGQWGSEKKMKSP